ncbi:MAG: microcin C transport system ATP-binding protein [Paracoccaceae bacterium]|jgi:microcin C transport system ATP-binding protein
MTVLQVQDLKVSFSQDGHIIQAVRGVSFHVGKGETLALVGESGSGKSVTALAALSLLTDAAEVEGSVRFNGVELLGADQEHLQKIRGNEVSFIFQEPMTSLNPLHTIEKQLAESLTLHQGLSGAAVRVRVISLLEKVGIHAAGSRLGAYPHQLSGGQRQRVMIAMALANGPQILIADEPTTALDVTIQAQILKLLQDLKKSDGLSLLFITHDLGIVRAIADRVCVMQNGVIVEQGETAVIFSNPTHPYTKNLLAAEPKGASPKAAGSSTPILQTKDLRVWFPIQRGLLRRTVGHVQAVNHTSISVRAGETLGIVGESGSGKSTLALAIMRLISSQGQIFFQGQNISTLSSKGMRALRRDIQIVFQDPFGSLSPRMTVEEIIAEGLKVHKPAERAAHHFIVANMMTEVGLDPASMGRYPHEFSGGQRQRIAIARAMVLRPKLLLLDEPTSALDMTVQVQIVDLLRDLQLKHGLAYIFISHDLRVVRALANHLIVMREGDVVEEGPAQSVFDAPKSDYTKALLAAALGGWFSKV